MLNAGIANDIVPVVCKIFPWTEGPTEQLQLRDSIAVDVRSLLTASYPSAVWVDVDSAIGQFRVGGDAGNLWDIKTIYNGDGVHLNAAGYLKVAEVIDTAISARYELQ
jgi:hypothetical protein